MILTNGATGYGGCRQTIKQREGKHSKGRDYLQRERLLTKGETNITKGENLAMGWESCQREGKFLCSHRQLPCCGQEKIR